jgi:hypothetical protein
VERLSSERSPARSDEDRDRGAGRTDSLRPREGGESVEAVDRALLPSCWDGAEDPRAVVLPAPPGPKR